MNNTTADLLFAALQRGDTERASALLAGPDGVEALLRVTRALAPHDFGEVATRATLLALAEERRGEAIGRAMLARVFGEPDNERARR